jgi:excinuclease ABC subunit C
MSAEIEPTEPAKKLPAKEKAKIDFERVLSKLANLPVSPGCYTFLDREGRVLYVGKAKVLRSRVRSYFQESGSDARYFIPFLRTLVGDIETFVTMTEKEAAVLENELIKKHQPRFNVKLRMTKFFVSAAGCSAWPRLETVRRPPPTVPNISGYHSATSARHTLHLVNKHFHLRTCSDADRFRKQPPAIQIKRCDAPCVARSTLRHTPRKPRRWGSFWRGDDELTRELGRWMNDASREMEFERAAIYRDQLRAVESIREHQSVVAVSDVDQDVIGIYREGANVEIEVLFVRAGRVTDSVSYSLRKIELPDEEVLSSFIAEFYGDGERGPLPEELLLPVAPDGIDGIAEWLSERRGRKVTLFVPQRGARKKLLEMAHENAKNAFQSKRRAAEDVETRLVELQEKLRLPTRPRRIECCDISHLGGNDTVGSVVALLDGVPDKRYRSFNVTTTSGGDDYGAMYEVLSRRFRRGKIVAAKPRQQRRCTRQRPRPSGWDLWTLFVVAVVAVSSTSPSLPRRLGLHDLAISDTRR